MNTKYVIRENRIVEACTGTIMYGDFKDTYLMHAILDILNKGIGPEWHTVNLELIRRGVRAQA